MNYAQQLRDPRWLALRQEVIHRAHNRCEACGAFTLPLHVHHSYYLRGRAAWQYPSESLKCLCAECHLALEQDLAVARWGLQKLGPSNRRTVIALIETLTDPNRVTIDTTEMLRKMFPGEDPATMFDDYREEEEG